MALAVAAANTSATTGGPMPDERTDEPADEGDPHGGSPLAQARARVLRLRLGDGNGIEFVCRLSPEALKTVEEATRAEVEKERLRLERFFEDCNPDMSFLEIRRRTTADKEMTGWSAWEVLRNRRRDIRGLVHMP